MRSSFPITYLVLVGVAVSSCVGSESESESKSESDGEPGPFLGAPDEIVAACARKSAVTVAQLFASDPAQREAQRSYAERACIAEAVAPGSQIAVEDIDRCTIALTGRDPCLLHLPAQCVPRPGTLSLGAKCVSAHQCGSGACSQRGKACGVCVAARNVGESCEERDCGLGLDCRPLTRSSRDGRCQTPARETETFSAIAELGWFGDPCVTDYSCRPALQCVAGKCAGGSLGSECTVSGFAFCEPGLTCDPPTRRCIQPPPFEGTGELGDECGDSQFCRQGLVCIRPYADRFSGSGRRAARTQVTRVHRAHAASRSRARARRMIPPVSVPSCARPRRRARMQPAV